MSGRLAPGNVDLRAACGLFLRTLGTLLFAGSFLNVSWAEDYSEPLTSVPPFLARAAITSQLNYSCPSNIACSFVCPTGVGVGGPGAGRGPGAAGGLGPVGGFLGADHVTKLTIYLGTISLGKGRDAPVLFYDFSTRERSNSSGFSISGGLSTSSCQVNGLALDYSGRPPPSSGMDARHK